MSDQDTDNSPASNQPGEPAQAHEQHSRWPGWIWSVPIAALAIVGYLGFQQFTRSGPTLHVTFPTGGAIKAQQTHVEYQGMDVGTVDTVTLSKDLKHVEVTLEMAPEMAGHLGRGTRFWVAGHPTVTDLASIKSVITGPHIGVEPHPGPTQDHYVGLGRRPVNAYETKGTQYVLRASRLGSITRGSTVEYHNMQVGEVADTALTADKQHFRIEVFIHAPYDSLVHDDTRFWDAGAVQVSMASGGPRLEFQSLPALLQGAIGMDTPHGAAGGPQAKAEMEFKLYESKGTAEHAPGSGSVSYRAVFHAADAGGLQGGAPVMLEHKQVGSVTQSTLQYDPATGRLEEAVTFGIEPWRIALAGNAHWAANPRAQMDALMNRLLAQGLRARIGSSIPLVGGKTVELAFVPGSKPASLGAGQPPEVPTGPESGIGGVLSAVNGVTAKIDSVATSINGVASKLDSVPIGQIGQEVHQVTKQLAQLSNSPELQQSLQNLDKTMANVEQISAEAKQQVKPTLEAVHRAAAEAEQAVASARSLLSNNQFTRNTPGTANLGEALYELTRAARSLRELANYLDQHPAALLHGRGG